MNRRQKIIVSVTGIFLVLLLLVGLTYAYFLTQITGNNNPKSISVSTANLALVYGDGNGIITSDELIMPGTTLDSKTFTVTNQGNAITDYVVVIDNASVVYAETRTVNGVTQTKGAATEFESNDFVYTLTCTNKDGSDCTNQIKSEQVFPIKGGVVVSNSIEVEGVQSYTLTVTYRETGVDQSADMNKELSARVNIKDISVDNPYKSDTTLLAYNIINNAMSVTEAQKEAGYAELVSNTKTTVASQISESYESEGYVIPEDKTMSVSTTYQGYYWTYATEYTVDPSTGKFSLVDAKTCKYSEANCIRDLVLAGEDVYIVSTSASSASSSSNTAKTSTNLTTIYKVMDAPASTTSSINITYRRMENMPESVMAATADEYGTSYYYRGAVKNNYLEFNGMCWRIVRIEGDGSIKITLAAQKACSQITAADTGSAFIGTGDYGYTVNSNSQYFADYENSANRTSSMKYKFNEWFNANMSSVSGKLKSEEICIGDTTSPYTSAGVLMTEAEKQAAISNGTSFDYKNYIRLDQVATLMCDINGNKTAASKIYPLTADEVVFAGGKVGTGINFTYYLRENASSGYWWTLSPSYFDGSNDFAFNVDSRGIVYPSGNNVSNDSRSLRPAVSLASSTVITKGDGTIGNPYTVD